ncbi:MAG: glycosyltransferase [Verrucomicrobia bacterium]|nr:glycosyltransferase [Verrucomicrobiota bacterium]
MRVVHFGKYYPPCRGGMEYFLSALCQGLVKKGVQCGVVAAVKGGSSGLQDDYGVLVRRMRALGTIRSQPICPEAIGVLRGVRAEIINLHHPNPLADISYLLAKPKGYLVVTYHSDILSHPWLSRLHTPLLYHILDMADAVVASSPQYVESSPVLQRYQHKIRVIPFGFDPPDFQIDQLSTYNERSEPQYLFIGRLVTYKGVSVLLKSLQYVPGHLWIAGTGPLEPKLKKQVEMSNLTRRVEFLGEISEKEKFQRLADCNVVILPSINRAEAFGIVLLEAMAMGRPVVVSDLFSGVRMLVKNGVNGFRFPPGDTKALAQVLRQLAQDPGLARWMGEMGRQLVRERYSLEEMLDRYHRLYKELCI